MSLHKIRRNLQVNGQITLGTGGDTGIQRSAANTLALLAGDTLDLTGSGDLLVPVGTVVPGSAVVTTNGQIQLGFDGSDNIQLGFRVNGTTVVWSALAGTGAVTSALS